MTGPAAPAMPSDADRAAATLDRSTDAKLSDRLYAHILERIIDGTFAPATRLPSEASLADRFTVSRPVVREALARLRDHGLVVSRQGSGTWVRQRPARAVLSFAPVASIADVQRCFEFRATFEGKAAGLAAQRRDAGALERIERAYDALEVVIATGEVGVDADFGFHVAVMQASGNHFFASTLAMLEDQIRTGMTVARNLSLQRQAMRLRQVQDEHLAIVDAIRGLDPARAEKAMIRHIENARRRIFEGDAADAGPGPR
jgi:GntR family transcriptional repressor for pyruvate dehydrogenase complex